MTTHTTPTTTTTTTDAYRVAMTDADTAADAPPWVRDILTTDHADHADAARDAASVAAWLHGADAGLHVVRHTTTTTTTTTTETTTTRCPTL